MKLGMKKPKVDEKDLIQKWKIVRGDKVYDSRGLFWIILPLMLPRPLSPLVAPCVCLGGDFGRKGCWEAGRGYQDYEEHEQTYRGWAQLCKDSFIRPPPPPLPPPRSFYY